MGVLHVSVSLFTLKLCFDGLAEKLQTPWSS